MPTIITNSLNILKVFLANVFSYLYWVSGKSGPCTRGLEDAQQIRIGRSLIMLVIVLGYWKNGNTCQINSQLNAIRYREVTRVSIILGPSLREKVFIRQKIKTSL